MVCLQEGGCNLLESGTGRAANWEARRCALRETELDEDRDGDGDDVTETLSVI